MYAAVNKVEINTLIFNELDHLKIAVEKVGAELEHHMLSDGPFDGKMVRVELEKGILYIEKYGCDLLCQGRTPPNFINFSVLTDMSGPFLYNSIELTEPSIGCLEESTLFSCKMSANTTLVSFHVKRDLLMSIGFDVDTFMGTIIALSGDKMSENIKEIKNLIDEINLLSVEEISQLNSAIVFNTMLSFFLQEYLNADESINTDKHKSDLLAEEVYAYITSHTSYVPTLEEICRDIGENARTLQRCFKKRYNISMWTFQKTHRLHMARKLFSDAAQEELTITKVALEYGFTHFGRFSRDYKSLFGELPSETSKSSL